MAFTRRRRALAVLAVTAALLAGAPAIAAAPRQTSTSTPRQAPDCTRAVLVLTAMPGELSPLVEAASLDPAATVRTGGHTFYQGRIGNVAVVMAMTGIGVANAGQTATTAFEYFHCGFAAAVFSGVAGSMYNIGDVTAASRWTADGGQTWIPADAHLLGVAAGLTSSPLGLIRSVPAGDAACSCVTAVSAQPTPLTLPQQPVFHVGGDGETTDPFGGYAVPCVPEGGDVTGCEPCVLDGDPRFEATTMVQKTQPLLDPRFFQALFTPPAPTTSTMVAQDEETAEVAAVAQRFGVPFIGFRAVSDGQGDPLHLPGFPVQFAVYRGLAAVNAARVAVAFLAAWDHDGRPGAAAPARSHLVHAG